MRNFGRRRRRYVPEPKDLGDIHRPSGPVPGEGALEDVVHEPAIRLPRPVAGKLPEGAVTDAGVDREIDHQIAAFEGEGGLSVPHKER